MLGRVFGAGSVAISTTVTVFMLGLGLGAFVAGRYADRIKHPGHSMLGGGGQRLVDTLLTGFIQHAEIDTQGIRGGDKFTQLIRGLGHGGTGTDRQQHISRQGHRDRVGQAVHAWGAFGYSRQTGSTGFGQFSRCRRINRGGQCL